jgi:type IV secretory pathway TraG/TraD family ATPase VirD4
MRLWPFVQNLSLFRGVYGETRWRELFSGCGVVQRFTPNGEFTEYLSRRIGEFTQMNVSTSRGKNWE